MLGIHVLNVGHGDSIVLELPDGSWGIVDCKDDSPPDEPTALRFLRARNIQRLAFVCLTHPHHDHFSGLPRILEHYGDRVDEMWCFRIDSHHWKNFLTTQKNAATTPSKFQSYEQLRTIFKRLKQMMDNQNRLQLLDANHKTLKFGEAEVDCLAPYPKELSRYHSSLARLAEHPDQNTADENQLSVVLRLKYGQSTVVLGSDATTSSWTDIVKESEKQKKSLASLLVKVSHHGSKEGFNKRAWERMASYGVTQAAISAGSQYGLPHRSVIDALRDLGVRPHCTNYAPNCLKTDRLDLSKFSGLSETQRLQLVMLDQSSNAKQRTCDGDLHFQIYQEGRIEFQHQYQGLCPYHLPLPSPA